MVSDDLMTIIQRLPLDEKVALLDTLMRTINEEVRHASSETARSPDAGHARKILGGEGQPPLFEELRGILAMGSPVPAG